MQKIIFTVSDELLNRIDESVKRWGFGSRSEFFRYATIDFIRHDGRYMPADDTLKEHSKTIKSVKVRQYLKH